MYFYDEYSELSQKNRVCVEKICRDANIRLSTQKLKVDNPASSWSGLRDTLPGSLNDRLQTLVDLSTMPREMIWVLFWFLDLYQCQIGYIYHRPLRYGDWLSRDPQRPRLVYKMSGLSSLRARTALLILAGYDIERTQQLIKFYELSITLHSISFQFISISLLGRHLLFAIGGSEIDGNPSARPLVAGVFDRG